MLVAVDPGVSGGIAADIDGKYEVQAMPATEGDIIALLRKYTVMAEEAGKVAYLENLVKHMGAGVPASTMAVYASNWGFILGALMMGGWRVELVTPQQWQGGLGLGNTGRQKANTKGMSANDAANEKRRVATINATLKREWKTKLKSKAQQLWPGTDVTLKTADAILILEFAKLRERGVK